jgi:ethanolamine utilization protein EutQ (cupin superfamily)
MNSEKTNPDKPISAGFYRLEKGTPLVYEYTYDEMKIIIEGQFQISDETGQSVHAKPGDVFYFPKGSKITFTTESYGLGFFVCFFFFLFFCFGWDEWFVLTGTGWTTGSRSCLNLDTSMCSVDRCVI